MYIVEVMRRKTGAFFMLSSVVFIFIYILFQKENVVVDVDVAIVGVIGDICELKKFVILFGFLFFVFAYAVSIFILVSIVMIGCK